MGEMTKLKLKYNLTFIYLFLYFSMPEALHSSFKLDNKKKTKATMCYSTKWIVLPICLPFLPTISDPSTDLLIRYFLNKRSNHLSI